MLAEGTILGNTYQIIEGIGSGGVGVVYKAYHLRLQKYVAVKMIKENFVGNINARGEADLLKKLHHPCLPQVYDFVQVGTAVYTVMDYISGLNLEDYLKNQAQVSQEEVCRWLEQLLEALVYLHRQKPAIIHSDIKPQNIIIDDDGNANLIDFNISLEENTVNIKGLSKQFASYEQLEAESLINSGLPCPVDILDVTTDLYSLGATFYYVMTGIVPYSGIVYEYPCLSFQLPYHASLTKIIDKAMQRDFTKRYASAAKMLSDVRNLRKKTWQYRLKKTGAAAGCIACIAVLTAGVIFAVKTVRDSGINKFEKRYETVIQLNGYTIEEENKIQEFLNASENQAYLSKQPSKKARLLYNVGNYYFINGDYESSAEYFKQAMDLDETESDYVRDYVISLARAGRLEAAQTELENAEKAGVDTQNLKEIKAEILIVQGQYKQAAAQSMEILNGGCSSEIEGRALMLYARANWKLQNYAECINYLSAISVAEENEDIQTLAIMNTYLNEAASTGNTVYRQNCYINAVYMYEKLTDKSVSSYNDKINVAAAYQNINRYDKAIILLSELTAEDSSNYKAFMYLAYCYYNQTKASGGDYSKVKEYYNRALPLYQSYASSGASDAEMIQLGNIVRGLN